MNTHTNPPAALPMATRFEGLDVLRTLLALCVALGHFFFWNGVTGRIPQTSFIAVDFFFALSGFVLTQSIFNDKSSDLRGFIKHFVTRRLFRLYPLYLLVFALWMPLLLINPGTRDPFFDYLISLTMIHAMGFANPNAHIFADTSIGIGWSISVEFWAGLPFFLAVYALRRNRVALGGLCLSLVFFGLLLMVNFSPNFMNVNLQKFAGIATFGEIRGFIGFAAGCLCYMAYSHIRLARPRVFLFTLIELAVAGLGIALYGRLGAYPQSNDFAAPFLGFAGILLLALRQGALSKLLYVKFLAPLRPLSYSIYLVHPFYVYAFRHLRISFDSGTHALIYLALLTATSALLYEGVERRFIVLGKRLGKAPAEVALG